MSRIWLITGVSKGLGRAVAQAALEAGDIVVGSLRQRSECDDFEAIAPGRAHARLHDVTELGAAAPLIESVERDVGPIDVLVNNAGYGHEGLFEESSIDDMRRQFEVNVFGVAAVTKAVLPFMRARRAGRIVNITSMAGLVSFPGLSLYHASKYALEGLSESVAKEVRGFGIYVTAVEPGTFRTEWAGGSMMRSPRAISDYDAFFDPQRARRAANSGHQIGNPAQLGAAILKLIAAENPPLHLLLGSDARQLVGEKLAQMQAEFDAWESVTLSTDFPA
ncbi:oxidoreductase [Sphingomonas abietis]|uniref:Oxidoreductase n=1 Tax=Sphingomonas abietis TaxID=3012344 RepID=A0ABY7NMU9_9SPHN|nr:oxidoreductase [Sphingomonas abietis]WBO21811.1 oxidoreductase [Sphingomonas abietis]